MVCARPTRSAIAASLAAVVGDVGAAQLRLAAVAAMHLQPLLQRQRRLLHLRSRLCRKTVSTSMYGRVRMPQAIDVR